MTDYQHEIQAFENKYLRLGRYHGPEEVYGYGFSYLPGDYVPITARYSAMLSHRWALRAAEMDNNPLI